MSDPLCLQDKEVLTFWFIPTPPDLFPWLMAIALWFLDASPVGEAYGILLAYAYLAIKTYVPALVGTPSLFTALLPAKIPQSSVQSWGHGSRLR